MESTTLHKPRKKSEPLTDNEVVALKEYRELYSTDVACAASIGIDRNVLERVILKGSGSPDTVAKIRKAIKKRKAA